MRFIRPLVQGTLPPFHEGGIVRSLSKEQVAELCHPLFRAAVHQVEERDQTFKPAEPSPVFQPDGTGCEQVMQVLHGSVKGALGPFILHAGGIHREHFADEQHGPEIIAFALLLAAGADPPVLLLAVHDGVHIPPGPGGQIFIPEKTGQRDKPVEPVGNALPALPVSADPRAVADIRPYPVQVSREPFGLDFQLTLQPALGLKIAIQDTVHVKLPPFDGCAR